MAKKESETKLILSETEKTDLKSAVTKLTKQQVALNTAALTENESKILEYIKTDL